MHPDLLSAPLVYSGDETFLAMPTLGGRATYGQWLRIVEEAEDWQFLVVRAGGMARKSDLDAWLMQRHGLDAGEAHEVANEVEQRNRRSWRRGFEGQIVWALRDRPEPTLEQYGLDAAALAQLGIPVRR